MRITLFVIGVCFILAGGCTVVSANRVFPKLAWYWSDDAKMQRAYDKEDKASTKAYQDSLKTNNITNP